MLRERGIVSITNRHFVTCSISEAFAESNQFWIATNSIHIKCVHKTVWLVTFQSECVRFRLEDVVVYTNIPHLATFCHPLITVLCILLKYIRC